MTATTGTPTTCGGDCQSTQNQAIAYMNAEVLWSTIFVNAWTDPALYQSLVDAQTAVANGTNPTAVNDLIMQLSTKYNLPTHIPTGVTLQIAFDTTAVVHLVFPAFQNIPPSPVDMVPHAL